MVGIKWNNSSAIMGCWHDCPEFFAVPRDITRSYSTKLNALYSLWWGSRSNYAGLLPNYMCDNFYCWQFSMRTTSKNSTGKPLQLFSKWCQQNSWTTKCGIAVSSYQLYPSPGGIFPYKCFGLQPPAHIFAIHKTIASAFILASPVVVLLLLLLYYSWQVALKMYISLWFELKPNVWSYQYHILSIKIVLWNFINFVNLKLPWMAEQRKRQRCQNKDMIIKLHLCVRWADWKSLRILIIMMV